MNTPKHTPGPWFTSDGDACIWPSTGERRAPIATVFTAQNPESEHSQESGEYTPEESANRLLIASAPALLQSLKEIVRKTYLRPGMYEDCHVHPTLIQAAREAVRKAEGRE